jgi:serine/tyrosine/threonine adenylyltransferase
MLSSSVPLFPLGTASDWSHAFADLGADFVQAVAPTPLPAPYWVGYSTQVAAGLGLEPDWQHQDAWLHTLAGNQSPTPRGACASVYSGHQFGQWAGQLGDGRALLLGETAGLEVQLKGAGLTPFSRSGDGRAVLRSSIREFLCSEAMHGLGIPTTRALCVVGSDAPVRRETLETAAVVTRVAPSFVRFGHFEHFCHHDQHPALRQLADYVIDRYYPTCRTDARWGHNPYAALLHAVTERTAHMVAQWQAVGFCHGVMNTDNMSILGLTIDYGPFQFLDAFDPGHICNHSDHQGRYAYYKQPNVAYWNLFCLGQALLPLIGQQEHAIAALETYKTAYPQALDRCMAAKLGVPHMSDALRKLADEVLHLMAADRVDYTIFWRSLSHWASTRNAADHRVRDLFINRTAIDQWLQQYTEHTQHLQPADMAGLMLKTNPKFVLRNYLGEQAIRAAKEKDFSVVAQLLHVLQTPFNEHTEFEAWAGLPPDWAAGISISCSS